MIPGTSYAFDITPDGEISEVAELPGRANDDVAYQLSQRADFFEEEIGLETTLKRPIVNTRDEPHADPQKYRRLHVIVGDANMSEFATWLNLAAVPAIADVNLDRISANEWLVRHAPFTHGDLAFGAANADELEADWDKIELIQALKNANGLSKTEYLKNYLQLPVSDSNNFRSRVILFILKNLGDDTSH